MRSEVPPPCTAKRRAASSADLGSAPFLGERILLEQADTAAFAGPAPSGRAGIDKLGDPLERPR